MTLSRLKRLCSVMAFCINNDDSVQSASDNKEKYPRHITLHLLIEIQSDTSISAVRCCGNIMCQVLDGM